MSHRARRRLSSIAVACAFVFALILIALFNPAAALAWLLSSAVITWMDDE